MTSPSKATVRKGLAALMDDMGFEPDTGAPGLYWHRRSGERLQIMRTVVWGLGSKPEPHLGVEVIADVTEELLDARDEAMRAGQMSTGRWTMDLTQISLNQDWDAVEAEFRERIAPKLA